MEYHFDEEGYREFEEHMQEVEEMLGSEIIKRYYFQKGYYTYVLRYDQELKRAIEEICKH